MWDRVPGAGRGTSQRADSISARRRRHRSDAGDAGSYGGVGDRRVTWVAAAAAFLTCVNRAAGQAPTITSATVNAAIGKVQLAWTPTLPQPPYYVVEGNPLNWAENMTGGVMASSWMWDAPACPTFPGNSVCGVSAVNGSFIQLTTSGVLDSSTPGVRGNMPVLLRPEVLDWREDFTVSTYVDTWSGNNNARVDNTAAGVVVVDADTGLPVMTMQIASSTTPVLTLEGREFGTLRITGLPTQSIGRMHLRLVYNSRNVQWLAYFRPPAQSYWTGPYVYTMLSSPLPGNRLLRRMRVGLHARSTNAAATWNALFNTFSLAVTDSAVVTPILFLVPGSSTVATVAAPFYLHYSYTVRPWTPNANTSMILQSFPTLGLQLEPAAPAHPIPLPTMVDSMGLVWWLDFTRERGGQRFVQWVEDRSGQQNHFVQTSASWQPRIQNLLGDRTGWSASTSYIDMMPTAPMASQSGFTGGEGTLIAVVRPSTYSTPGVNNAFISKGGYDDVTPGWAIWTSYSSVSGMSLNFKVRTQAGPGGENVAGIQRVPTFPTGSPVSFTFMSRNHSQGCHWRQLFGHEYDNSGTFGSPWVQGAVSNWVNQTSNTVTDADGLYRVATEVTPCTYSAACQPGCSYSFADGSGGTAPLRIGAEPNGTPRLQGEVYELMFFRGSAVTGAQLNATMAYLSEKYYLNCPDVRHWSANITLAYTVNCTGPPGSFCYVRCNDAGAAVIAGSTFRSCGNGQWGTAPSCSRTCPFLFRPPGIASCSYIRIHDQFKPAEPWMAATELYRYTIVPQRPEVDRWGKMVRLIPGGGVLIDSTAYLHLTRSDAPITVTQSGPTWLTQTTASDSITVSATFRVLSGAAGVAWRIVDYGSVIYQYRVMIAAAADTGMRTVQLQRVTQYIGFSTGFFSVLASAVMPAVQLGTNITLSANMLGNIMTTYWNGSVLHGPITDPSPLQHGPAGMVVEGIAEFYDFSVATQCNAGDTVSSAVGMSEVRYVCRPGYLANSSTLRTCSAAGVWSGNTSFGCDAIPPVFANTTISVAENTPVDTAVGAPLLATSLLSIVYTLVSDSSQGLFKIDACSGQVRVALDAINYEAQAVYTLLVSAAIAEAPSAATLRTVTVRVLDVNEPPTLTTTAVSISEGAGFGVAATPNLLCADPEGDPCDFSIVSGNTGGVFIIRQVNGFTAQLVVNATGVLDFETAPTLSLIIRVYDAMSRSEVVSVVAVTVTDANEPPIFAGGQMVDLAESAARAASASEPASASAAVSAVDRDAGDTLTYAVRGVTGGLGATGASPRLPTDTFSITAAGLLELRAPLVIVDDSVETLFAGRYTRAVWNVEVAVIDAAGAAAVANVTVVVPLDGAGSSAPIITGVTAPATPSTMGGDVIIFAGLNLDSLVGSPSINITLTYGPYAPPTRCMAMPAVLGAGGRPAQIECLTMPGIGGDYPYNVRANGNRLRMTTRFAFSYGPPEVTLVSSIPPGGVVGPGLPVPGALSTMGNEVVYLHGMRFGSSSALVTVSYGAAGATPAFHASIVSVANDALAIRTAPGLGVGLVFTVTVAGLTTVTTAGLTVSYAAPTITTITLAATGGPAMDLPTVGGTAVVITGANFGPYTLPDGAAVNAVLTYGHEQATSRHVYTAASCYKNSDPVLTHSVMYCTTAAGVGGRLFAAVTISSRSSDPAATPMLAYLPPVITRISGVGGSGAADTAGGQALEVEGLGFGPAADDGVVTVVDVTNPRVARGIGGLWYGPYAADRCRVVTDTRIECITVAGTGSGHVLTISIAGQRFTWNGTGASQIGYGQPFVYELGGPGSRNASTEGGEVVVVLGRNFGAVWNPAVSTVRYSLAQAAAAGSSGGGRNVTFVASNCAITVPHTELRCVTVEGAGRALSWSVEVDGQPSTVPLSDFGEPRIFSVRSAAGGVVVRNGTAGEWVEVTGMNFGPAAAAALVDSVTYGPTGMESTYIAREVTVMSHRALRFRLVEGIGTNLAVVITVAGQASARSGDTVSYAPPRVASVMPRVLPTDAGGANTEVVVTGSGFGLDDPAATVAVLFGNSGDGTLTAAPLSIVGGAVLPGGLHRISFRLPAGVGANRAVRVLVYRRALGFTDPRSTMTSDPIADTPPMTVMDDDVPAAGVNNRTGAGSFFSFASPSLDAVVVSLPRSAAERAAVAMYTTCVNDTITYCGYRILQLLGANFGPPPASVTDSVTRQVVFGQWGTGANAAATITPPLEWSHGRITVLSREARAAVGVVLTARSVTGAVQVAATAMVSYQALSPAVAALTGAITGVPTSGGTAANMLGLAVANMDPQRPIRVTVGGSDCPLYDATGTVALTAAAAALTLVQPDGSATLRCVVPPGSGTANAVQVLSLDNGVWRPSAVAADLVVDYAPPSVTQFGLQVAEGSTPMDPSTFLLYTASVGASLTLPTQTTRHIKLLGANFGLCPIVRIGSAMMFACDDAARGIVASRGVTATHTSIVLPAPAGEGIGLTLSVVVADQTATPGVTVAYEPPMVTEVVATDSATGLPTSGGVRIIVRGTNFGERLAGTFPQPSLFVTPTFAMDISDPAPPIVRLRLPAAATPLNASEFPFPPPYDGSDGFRLCLNVVRVSHSELTCLLPAGSGIDIDVEVTVGNGLRTVTPAVASYDPPIIDAIGCSWCWTGEYVRSDGGGSAVWAQQYAPYAVSASANASAMPGHSGQVVAVRPPVAAVDGAGNPVIITLRGRNFGGAASGTLPNGRPVNCVFLSWPYRPGAAAGPHTEPPSCDGAETHHGEGELDGAAIIAHTHTAITFRLPRLRQGGTRDVVVSINGNLVVTAAAPPGAQPVPRLLFAPPHVTSMQPRAGGTDGGDLVVVRGINFGTAVQDVVNTPVSFPVPLSAMAALPPLPGAPLRVDMHRACVSDGIEMDGSVPLFLTSCRRTFVTHTDTEIIFASAPGIGVNRTVNVSVVESLPPGGYWQAPSASHTSWPPQFWSYLPPVIDVALPAVVLLRGTATPSITFALAGRNFGREEDATRDRWTAEERVVGLLIGGKACETVTRGTQGSLSVVQCTTPATMAGSKNLTLTIAGQATFMSADDRNAFVVACDVGYVARPGEACISCPAGASCRGYNAMLPWDNALGAAPRFVDPVPLPGFYNLNDTARGACPPSADVPGRAWCIAPCEPAHACLGDNVCEDGYESKAPMWRCSSCAAGFFRRASECVRCPSSPFALLIGFAVLALCATGAGYLLNRKGFDLAFISIAVDFFQVLGMFLNAKVRWPPAVKELLYLLSAFNLNIEIVAPECLVPTVSYTQKVAFILLLPLLITLIAATVTGVFAAWKLWVLRRSRKMVCGHSPAAVAATLTIWYFLYLYECRTVLDMMNCAPTTPPTYKSNGALIRYLSAVFEECDVPGGTHLMLLPVAVGGLAAYCFGYPLGLIAKLFSNRELAMQDQLLRAKGSGSDRLSNPLAYNFRKSYGRTYYMFKPDFVLWVGAIFLRKFGIAVTSIVFNRTAAFQMAGCLLVMFLAYAAQVKWNPYMGRNDFDTVLARNAQQALQSALHARLEATLSSVEQRGRKRAHRNIMAFNGKVDKRALLGAMGSWLFDYNTAESLLLFAAVIVSLMGLMYIATVVSGSYTDSQDSLTAVVVLVIIVAILYILVLILGELVATCRTSQATTPRSKAGADNRKAVASATDSPRGTAGSSVSTPTGSDRRLGAMRAARRGVHSGTGEPTNLGVVESQINRMFLLDRGDSSEAGAGVRGTLTSTLMAFADTVPPLDLWLVFQAQFQHQAQQLNEMRASLDASRRSEALLRARTSGGSDEVSARKDRPANTRPKRRAEYEPQQAIGGGDDAPASAVAAAGDHSGRSDRRQSQFRPSSASSSAAGNQHAFLLSAGLAVQNPLRLANKGLAKSPSGASTRTLSLARATAASSDAETTARRRSTADEEATPSGSVGGGGESSRDGDGAST